MSDMTEQTDAEWLTQMFEYEYCAECGWDASRHTVGPDPLGLRHAYCDDSISDELTDAEVEIEMARRTAQRDYVSDMVTAYITAGLWATSDTRPGQDEDATPEPLDDDYDESDLSAAARASIEADCLAFAQDNWADLKDMDPQQAGHDFLLTRDRHGAGFWDRGLGDKGDRLTKACRPWGESGLYVGDDEQVHTTNQSACSDCGCQR